MSGADSAQERLEVAWQILQAQWQRTRELWDDPVQQSFERNLWGVYEAIVPADIAEMERLAQTIEQARRGVK
jgi:hypothetical protein